MNKKKTSADLLGTLIQSSKAKPVEARSFDKIAELIEHTEHTPERPTQPADHLLQGLKPRRTGASGSVKLDAELYAWVRAYALERGLYPSQVINALIADFRQRVTNSSKN